MLVVLIEIDTSDSCEMVMDIAESQQVCSKLEVDGCGILGQADFFYLAWKDSVLYTAKLG